MTPAAVLGTAAVVVLGTVSPVGAASSPVPTGPAPGQPVGSVPASLAAAPVRVMLVGDSTAFTLGLGLAAEQAPWYVEIENLAILGCGIVLGNFLWTDVQGSLQEAQAASACHPQPVGGDVPWPQAWPRWLREVRPNVVVLLAGRWEVMDRLFRGVRTNILQPRFATYLKQELEEAVRVGTSTGARMVLMTAPCYSSGDQNNGDPWPQDDIRRVEKYNSLVRSVGAEFPKTVTVQNLFGLVCPDGRYESTIGSVVVRDADGVHFPAQPGTGGEFLAPKILPLWEEIGHLQEESGGAVVTGPLPARVSRP